MSLLKDKVRIMTKDLKLQRVKLSGLFTILLGRLPLEEAYLLQLRATTILREFDDMLHELDFLLHEIEGGG
jgi:hypothetical protein